MVTDAEEDTSGARCAAEVEPRFRRAIARAGYPEPRMRDRGYATLLRTIVGQQVSVAAAASIWRKLEAASATRRPGEHRAARDELRAAGLSRQKAGYARSLAEEVTSGRLDLDELPADDEEAIASWSRSRASAAGRRKSTCCSPKGAPTSGRRATWRCRSRSAASSATRAPERKGDPRAGRALAPPPRRRGDLRLAPLQGRYGGDLGAGGSSARNR